MTEHTTSRIPLAVALIPVLVLLAPPAHAGGQPASVGVAPPACAASMSAWKQALEQDADNASLRNRLGLCYERLGEHRRARREFRRAVRADSHYAEGWNNLGAIEYADGNLGSAITDYLNAVAVRPTFAIAYRNLGAAYLAKGEIENGLAAYREALRLDPSSIETHAGVSVTGRGLSSREQYYYLAKLFSSDGRVDAALDYLAKARSVGFRDFDKVRRDPDFQAVVADARFGPLSQ